MVHDKHAHWDDVYGRQDEADLSWHEDEARVSLDLTAQAGGGAGSSIVDIGGGTSRYVDGLLAMGLTEVTVLDLSQVAIDMARARLTQRGRSVNWIRADITTWSPDRSFDIWHDRAVFHFLVDETDRAAYLNRLCLALGNGGHAIIGTFAPDGPTTCSGLAVQRYSPADLAATLGNRFRLVTQHAHLHRSPKGAGQSFQFCLFQKLR